MFWSFLHSRICCTATNRANPPANKTGRPETDVNKEAEVNPVPVIHVFVALADNVNQGIVPVSASLGNGVDGWLKKETDEQIRLRAADAYHKYQKCGVRAARGLFATGW